MQGVQAASGQAVGAVHDAVGASSWTSDLSLGVAFMDHEHACIAQVLADLERLARGELTPDTRTRTRLALERAWSLVTAHFAHEEQLMVSRGYPNAADHQRQHHQFLDELQEMRVTCGGDPECRMTQGMVAFVQTWFARHTRGADRDLADWLGRDPEVPFVVWPRRHR